MENFPELIEKIKNALQLPLPGKIAQQKMLPLETDPGRERGAINSATKQGSVLILLYPKAKKMWFPLMQRPDYNGVHGGQISLPGGKKEKQDKDFIATAIRETEEEIGVPADQINVIGVLSELYVSASNFTVMPVVGYCDAEPMFIPNPYEVKEVIEFSTELLLTKGRANIKEISVAGYKIKTPYFAVKDKVVWGATAMILSEFQAILELVE